jgi:DNA-binding MarR family transcriptional regulator
VPGKPAGAAATGGVARVAQQQPPQLIGDAVSRSTRQHLYQRVVDGVEGLDVTTYPVLSGLARLGPTTATHLASVIGVDRSATARYASKLERAGLVYRQVDPSDARATQLALTPAGLTAVAMSRDALSSTIGNILVTWSAAEVAAFASTLERFTDLLENPEQ